MIKKKEKNHLNLYGAVWISTKISSITLIFSPFQVSTNLPLSIPKKKKPNLPLGHIGSH